MYSRTSRYRDQAGRKCSWLSTPDNDPLRVRETLFIMIKPSWVFNSGKMEPSSLWGHSGWSLSKLKDHQLYCQRSKFTLSLIIRSLPQSIETASALHVILLPFKFLHVSHPCYTLKQVSQGFVRLQPEPQHVSWCQLTPEVPACSQRSSPDRQLPDLRIICLLFSCWLSFCLTLVIHLVLMFQPAAASKMAWHTVYIHNWYSLFLISEKSVSYETVCF